MIIRFMTEDRLDAQIRAALAELANLDADIAALNSRRQIAAVRLEAFQEAARLRPYPVDSEQSGTLPGVVSPASPRKSGRQVGAISTAWKRTLVDWDDADLIGDGLTYADIHTIATGNGIETTLPSVRDRVRRYCEDLRYVERSPGDKFRVNPEVANRFRAALGMETKSSLPESKAEMGEDNPQPVTKEDGFDGL
jgi:hypothetical protein